jgi:hypothetical protein
MACACAIVAKIAWRRWTIPRPDLRYFNKAGRKIIRACAAGFALSRPRVVNKTYRRARSKELIWFGHEVCGEGNVHVGIGKEVYSQQRRPADARREGPAAAGSALFKEVRPADAGADLQPGWSEA